MAEKTPRPPAGSAAVEPHAPGHPREGPAAPPWTPPPDTLATLLDALDDPAALIDPQAKVLAANRAMGRCTGAPPGDLLGRCLLEMAPAHLTETRRETFERVFRSGAPARFEEEHEGRWFDHVAYPVFEGAGRVGKVAVLARDITQRKRMEDALRQSETTSRSILGAAPIGIGLVREGVFHWVSDRMCDLVGYASGELVGSCPRMLAEYDGDGGLAGEAGAGASILPRCGELETRWRHKDGHPLDILLRFAPVNPDRPEEGVTFTAQDVTDRKRMEQEILKAQRIESLSVLAGGIAHDFNNLLTAVLACVTALRHNPHLQAHEHTMLAQAETATLRARNLTQKLLSFGKGGAPIRTTFSLETLLRETAAFALSGSRTVCDIRVDAGLRPVYADAGQVRQALQNLIVNADQAMPGGGKLVIRAENVTLEDAPRLQLKGGEFVRVSIQDHGCGIPERERSRIFDPFFSTKEKGRGLGLSAAYTIVRRHQGRIQVDSRVGLGTCVQVTLPASAEPLPQPRPARLPAPLPTGGVLNVLIVDDEEIIRESTGAILERLGCRVAQARDGAEGIERYRRSLEEGAPFDVVIMDLTIPGGMGGEKAVQELKRIDPRARVIVSSGYCQDPVMSRFQEYGFSGVLPKPYRMAELQEVLSEVLSQGQT